MWAVYGALRDVAAKVTESIKVRKMPAVAMPVDCGFLTGSPAPLIPASAPLTSLHYQPSPPQPVRAALHILACVGSTDNFAGVGRPRVLMATAKEGETLRMELPAGYFRDCCVM